MILIRLKKQSSGKRLTFSIIVSKKNSSPKSEGFIENIGHYKPLLDKWSNKYVFIDLDRLLF
jgi:ribosomal protein S16